MALVKRFVYTGGTETFTMPGGFKPEVGVYLWGAGGAAGGSDGSNGPGGVGGGGWFYSNTLTINAGDTVTVAVGGGGSGGIGSTGGGAGAGGPSYSAVTNWSTLNILTGDNLRVTNGAYCSFLNTYGIWNYNESYPSFDQTVTVNFSYTGYYNIVGSCDNYGTVYIDGNAVLSIPGFQSTVSSTVYITAGNHSVRLYGVNEGGPGSLGVAISSSFRGGRGGNAGPYGWSGGGGGGGGATVLLVNGVPYIAAGGGGGGGGSWNRTGDSANNHYTISNGDTTGGDCGGDGGGGGGGGGPLGAGGHAGSDNNRGGGAGSAGSSTPGAVGADGDSPGGSSNRYYTSSVGLGGMYYPWGSYGMPGQAVLVMTPAAAGRVKVGGEWKPVNTLSVKVDGSWRGIESAWVKQSGVWHQISSIGSPNSISTTFSTTNFG